MIVKLIALAIGAGLGISVFIPNPQNLLTTFENGQKLYAVGEYRHATEEYLKVVHFKNKAVDIH
ncbi:MAG: hypothetical protein HY709_06850, partial [Candidatus Latescibacteria bacterium]|nr:hypothetical protein [Candidatus Latescibacterota bacterium]